MKKEIDFVGVSSCFQNVNSGIIAAPGDFSTLGLMYQFSMVLYFRPWAKQTSPHIIQAKSLVQYPMCL